jgi:histidinol-phosphate aminotransferase
MRGARRDFLLGAGAALAASATACATAPNATPALGRLSLNENSFGPSPRVIEAIQSNLGNLERYVDAGEIERLVGQIAAFERVPAEQIVLGEILEPLGVQLAAARAGGGEFVYSAPGYTALIDASTALGGRGRPVPLNPALENDLLALSAAIGANTLAVSLVNPHNPSGTLNTASAFDTFVRDAARRTLVVIDEAYLEYDAFEARSAIRFARAGENVLVFRTLAKIYGLAGISIGYAVAPTPLAARLKAAGLGAPHSINRLSLVAAEAALADQAYVSRVVQRVRANRDAVHEALDALGLRHTDSRANFVFFESPRPADIAREALRARGIIPGRAFPPLDQWIRVTIGTEAETDATISALRAIYS